MKSSLRQCAGALLKVLQAMVLAATVASCSSGGDSSGSSPPPVSPPPPAPGTVSGLLQYEIPPPAQNCNGLNFDAVELRPIRQATVQLIDANSRAVLDSTVSDETGQYVLHVAPQTSAFVRVRAELKSTSPAWDVQVRNNVVDPGNQNPKPLATRPIYTMSGKSFNSGTEGHIRNLTATTGWGGSS